MFLNRHLFFLAHPSHLTVWNYKEHQQFELTPEFYLRLFEILRNPDQFDRMRATDKQLLAAQILVATKQEDLEWGWDVLSKIYHFGTKDIPYASSPKNIKEWAQQYAQHCKEAIGKVTPVMSSLDEDTAIFLPPPVVDPDRSDLIRNLIERKTCRQFSGSAVNLSILSTTLYYSLGHLKEREEDEGLVFEEYSKRRCAPSGGGG